MTREEIYDKLNEVFQDVFDDEDITVNDATVASDVDGWDSLEHINLIVAVERCFGIKFTMGRELNTPGADERSLVAIIVRVAPATDSPNNTYDQIRPFLLSIRTSMMQSRHITTWIQPLRLLVGSCMRPIFSIAPFNLIARNAFNPISKKLNTMQIF